MYDKLMDDPQPEDLLPKVPAPKLGGTLIYCPHSTVTVEKKGRKRVETIVHCKFKTRNLRKYRRHYIRRHADLPPAEPQQRPSVTVKPLAPKYPEGDHRRRPRKPVAV